MSGSRIFFTDSSSTIGAALAERFAEAGHDVTAVNYRGNISAVRGLEGDFTDEEDASRLSAIVCSQPPCLIVLSADSHAVFGISDFSIEAFHKVMRDNVKSAYFAFRLMAPAMSAAGGGRFLALSSIFADKPSGCSVAYSVSKAALSMLCLEAAVELGGMGVTVNLLELGNIAGDERMTSALTRIHQRLDKKIPIGRLPTHDDIYAAATAVGLGDIPCLNGAVLRLDGGFVLHYVLKDSPPEP